MAKIAGLISLILFAVGCGKSPSEKLTSLSEEFVYTSLAFSTRLAELELDQSFSAVGSCYDNAAVESFFATLKRELAWIHQRTTWPTRAQLQTALFDYIEAFYNPERIQQRLDNRSPIDFEHHAVA